MKKSAVYLGYVMILSISLATSCVKKDTTPNNTDIITTTPEVTPSIAPVVDNKVEITPTLPMIEEPKYIDENEATKLIVDAILERGYYVGYNQDITIGDNEYYEFSILNGEDIMKPNVVVNKITGELSCLNEDKTISPLSSHPLLSSMEPKDDEGDKTVEGEFTKEDAYLKLSKVSKDVLELPAQLSEYTIIYDDYNSMIKEQECYGINVFAKVEDKKILMKVLYVSVDGQAMYKFDVETDEFVEIK